MYCAPAAASLGAVLLVLLMTVVQAFELGHTGGSSELLRRTRRDIQSNEYVCNVGTIFECVCQSPPSDAPLAEGILTCSALIEGETIFLNSAAKVTMTYTPPPQHSDLNVTTNLQSATAHVLNRHCSRSEKDLSKCGIDINDDSFNVTLGLFESANVVILSVEESGSGPSELQISMLVVYHEKPGLQSSSLYKTISGASISISDFHAVSFGVLYEAVTTSIVAGVMTRVLGVEVHTLGRYHVGFPLVEVVVGSIFGALFILICILSACKASRDRKDISARIAAREEKKCIVEAPRDSPDDAAEEYVQQTHQLPANGTAAQANGTSLPPANGNGPPAANGVNSVGGGAVAANGVAGGESIQAVPIEVHKNGEHAADDAMKVEEIETEVVEGGDRGGGEKNGDVNSKELSKQESKEKEEKSKNGVVNEAYTPQ